MNKLSAAAIALSVLALSACKNQDSWFFEQHGHTTTDPGSPQLVFNSNFRSAKLMIGIGNVSGSSQTKPLYVTGGVYFQRNDKTCHPTLIPDFDGCHDQGTIVVNQSSLTIPSTLSGTADADLNLWRGADCTPGRCTGSVTVRFDNHDSTSVTPDWCNSETVSWDESYDGTTNTQLSVDQQTDLMPCSAVIAAANKGPS